MRKTIFIMAILMAVFTNSFAQNYGSFNLYASYDFENGVADAQSNTALTLHNGAQVTEDAVRGKVLSFDVSSKGYALFDPAPIVSDTISLSFWFKRSSSDTSGPWKQIFEFHNPADDSNIYLMPVDGWDATNSHLVCDTRSFYVDIYQSLSGEEIKADDAWHHIAVVISGEDWAYYLNGKLQSTTRILGAMSVQNPRYLYLGTNPNRGDFPMSSSIDDFRIYHSTLVQSQINQLVAGEEVTAPPVEEDSSIIFHLEGNLTEESGTISLSGTGYSFANDVEVGGYLKLEAGGQMNFDKEPFAAGNSTINFLYMKEEFTAADNNKYIFQCSNDNNSYGLYLDVADNGTAALVLERVVDGVQTTTKSSAALNPGEWNAISIHYAVNSTNVSGTVRIYQNGSGNRIIAAANIATFSLGFDKWCLGATDAANTAGGGYKEIVIVDYSMSTTEIDSYYNANASFIEVVADYSDTKQTIHNFGASDAWNSQLIGLHWPEEKKEKLAELLFSTEFDEDGNPKGIGLSAWRFNIGSGSAEQGDASYINREAGRTECFLNEDGTYDWSKQAGQQWFLKKAVLDYGVEDVVGFMNSPPVYFNRDGVAFNKNNSWSYILLDDKYDDYAKFTADVVEHFAGEGIKFGYISPLNEPQYQWNADADNKTTIGQEGSPATNEEIVRVVKAMSQEFSSRGLDTQLTVAEAGSIESAMKQVPYFWGDKDADLKIKGLPNVSNYVASHSYWNDGSPTSMVNTRVDLRNQLDEIGTEMEFWQTEYSLLGSGYQDWGHPNAIKGFYKEIECAISLARMLHVDMVFAEATAWHWWTTFEMTNHGGEARFALIEALSRKDLTDGIYNDCKLLYTLGQYSRFIRPGMKRIGLTSSDSYTDTEALSNQMFSSYLNETTGEVVIIATNTSYGEVNIKLNVDNMPIEDGDELTFIPYVTSDTDDMKAYPAIKAGAKFTMPALSIVTFVSKVGDPITEVEDVIADAKPEVKIYPNPVVDQLNLTDCEGYNQLMIVDITGNVIIRESIAGRTEVQLPVNSLLNGIYFITLTGENGKYTQKIIKR